MPANKQYPAEYYDNKVVNLLVDRKAVFEKILARISKERTYTSTLEYDSKGDNKKLKMRASIALLGCGLNLEHIADILDIP